MLVLGMAREDRIIIVVPPSAEPTRIDLACVETGRERARLGFNAPRAVSIDRLCVFEDKQRDARRRGLADGSAATAIASADGYVRR